MGDDGRASKYSQFGVDARKGGYGKLFTSVSVEAFPSAFCKMYINPETGLVEAQHGDGVGSKSVQRYIHWRETGDASVFKGDVDDCIEMNFGDIACAGLELLKFTDNIAINKMRIPKEVYLSAINERMAELLELYKSHGMPFVFAGGETADLPDQVRTYVFDGTVTAAAPKERVITCDKIASGDIIMGLRSGGFCNLEEGLNSGIMSNGLTLARHCLMSSKYEKKYPETKDPDGKGYKGRFLLDDKLDNSDAIKFNGMSVGDALISPTRHFSIIIHELLRRYGNEVHGVVLNTGGGQTKCTRVGKGIKYVKDNLPCPDPIFQEIKKSSGESWEDMFADFNVGIGVDIIGPDDKAFNNHVTELAGEFNIGCMRTGYCEPSGSERNKLLIKHGNRNFEYDAE